jgi:hypothetical protein
MDLWTDLVQWFTSTIWSETGFWGEVIGGSAAPNESDGGYEEPRTDLWGLPIDGSTPAFTAQGNSDAYNSINSSSVYSTSGLSETAQLSAPTGLLNTVDPSTPMFDVPFSSGSRDTSGWLAWGGPAVGASDQNTASDFDPSSPLATGAGASDSQSGTRIVDDKWEFGTQTPIDQRDVFGDGNTYYHYGEVTIDGVDYDAYKSENLSVLHWNQVLLVPAPAADPTFAPIFSGPSYVGTTFSDPSHVGTTDPSSLGATGWRGALGATSQILSGTYADSVLQRQLSSQGQAPGSFVSPIAPNDYLFNPNAKSLLDSTLLSSHSPNTQLLQAEAAQVGVSMLPIIGSVATWMNPQSSGGAKGIALATGVLDVLPLAGAVAGELGVLSKAAGTMTELSELGSLSAKSEVGGLTAASGEGLRGAIATVQDILGLRQELEEAGVQVISIKDARGWTQLEKEAYFEYERVFQETGKFTKAGDAFSGALGAASGGQTGPDRIIFDFVNEIKTSAGHPDISIFTDALEQAEVHAAAGFHDGAVVTVYDTINLVKYFVQRAP